MASFKLCSSGTALLRQFRGTTSVIPHMKHQLLCEGRLFSPSRYLCSSSTGTKNPSDTVKDVKQHEPPTAKRNPFLDRLLAPDSSGESPVLRMMGYYTAESKAIGAAKSLYSQILKRSLSAVATEYPSQVHDEFLPQYEIMSIHIYLTLRRLRFEKGSPHESDVKVAMQTLFDIFWSDVRNRMMVEENNLTFLQSAKWIKQCERNFFGMALAFDEAWGDDAKMVDSISAHLTSLRKDQRKAKRIQVYMNRERARLEKLTVTHIWQDISWDAKYPLVLN